MGDTHQTDLLRSTGATFCPDRIFRYRLWRSWDPEKPALNWIMLNPSTATESKNDPTVTRCERFAQRWGFGGIVVTNLFAYRATEPKDLYALKEPVGPENDEHLVEAAAQAARVVLAWGDHGELRDRGRTVARMLFDAGVDPFCLSVNVSGHPAHPLYRPRTDEPRPFPIGEYVGVKLGPVRS